MNVVVVLDTSGGGRPVGKGTGLRETDTRVSKKDGWIRIKLHELDFFGRYADSVGNLFTVAFSDGHLKRDGAETHWVDGKIVLLRDETVLWYKDLHRPASCKVTPNGDVVVCDWGHKNDRRLGGSLLVFDFKGETLLRREFDCNLGDCNVTSDGKTCFLYTLAPDNTLYALDVPANKVLWSVKDKNLTTGKIMLDEQRQVIEIEKPGLGVARTLDFSGQSAGGESQTALARLEAAATGKEFAQAILDLLGSSNKAVILEALERTKSILSRKKVQLDATQLVRKLQEILGSGQGKLSDLAFDNLVRLYETRLASKEGTIDFLTNSLRSRPLDEKILYRLTRIARADVNSLESFMPSVTSCLESSPRWNDRRWAAFVIGEVGGKAPELAKQAVPIMIRYMTVPEKVKEQRVFERTRRVIRGVRAPETRVVFDLTRPPGMDPGSMLKDACIDAVGRIGSAEPGLVSEAIGVLRQIASSDASEYSRKKALAAINSIERRDID